MNRAQKMLEVLRDGQPHTRREIFDRAGFMLTNNAATELRDLGYDIKHTRKRVNGDIVYSYQIVGSLSETSDQSTANEPAASLGVGSPSGPRNRNDEGGRLDVSDRDVGARFWRMAIVGRGDQCWGWRGARDANGYFRLRVNGRREHAHRFSYELNIGPIPEGTEIDHLCRNRACVNPAHLEAVPHRENVLRGSGPTAINAAKTHCDAGHEFTEENTYRNPRGSRECRACKRAYDLKREGRSDSENEPLFEITDYGMGGKPAWG